MKQIKTPLIVSLSTIFIYILTKYPLTKPYALQVVFLLFIILLILAFKMKKKNEHMLLNVNMRVIFIAFILLLVGSTGWILSPFFYLLYLLAILFSFFFSTMTALVFIATIIALLTLSIGEIDILYTVLVEISFLTVIPVIYYLKKQKPSV